MTNLTQLREDVQRCTACGLHEITDKAVFGEGAADAQVMFVGEQPGDKEDREGHPFVGPAGRLLDQALEEAGIDRSLVYVTNTVKRFNHSERGKRRIHERPRAEHIKACRQWLDAELAEVKPKVLVCLGAVPAQALVGRHVKVTQDHGQPLESDLADVVIVTVHPSSILRQRDEDARQQAYRGFVEDLREVARRVGPTP
ncbi:UdgX family uracil-DNA binding protein [Solirubrobacter deserti]|uniref:Type-4 uracil-DNA glycosylase n=1 Tax=Solirubrobacter deserti TaxID=2282478 RepID=A0ABT4REB5_9ACTN|nr:UdgX family uracil-DNA binding protein [Solirubrobacter deserti]MDA0136843.1 UdgX family uracil-DNA binding protein [Solirubrobacter deserti]